ncbi:MAG: gas vesicle protein GvpJ [Nitrososphaerales archaeon]
MDLIDRILDKGLVIDLYIRLALVGIELLEIQARIVISGVESYIKYAGQMQKLGLVAKPLSTA